MQLETQRLNLIACTEDYVSNLSVEEYEMGPHIELHLLELKNSPSNKGWGVWFVINKENDMIIGDVGFKGKSNSENAVEVGYGIIPSAQGKGFATEAVEAIIKWAFSTDEVMKINAECLDDNLASIKVLEKLQMNRIGIEDNMIKWQLLRNGNHIE
ncbi:GNAT family N-acetyltransferase [Chengkuizengella axinellae]|uniref:GNAT family N-acetyltransferase n=1 Tax=Chengkuizengella axinellae TaxID=3064388 RepID=A0ABT9J1C7_9BACL|nr:GNAT family N-acetyltransferase [Chengkuizengella sp. 2205SS18-9]MDP5275397.1 GNAT family N-acetyltransferase [Chengkuizengella sp. 2205SS18-9]